MVGVCFGKNRDLWLGSEQNQNEPTMNHSNDTASDSGFPALFVVLSTFVGVLVWLCVMLNSLAP